VLSLPEAIEHRIPRPIAHFGSCGQRSRCWRSSCREHWSGTLTVETLRNRWIVAHCHGASYSGAGDFELKVELWRHGSESESAA
jgi:hypothetical protein